MSKDIKVNLVFVFIFLWGGAGLSEMQQVTQLAHHTVSMVATLS